MTLTLEYEKATKNKYVYKDTSNDPVIEAVYIKRVAVDKLGGDPTESLTITIKKADN